MKGPRRSFSEADKRAVRAMSLGFCSNPRCLQQRTESHHIGGVRDDRSPRRLLPLCPGCHAEVTYGQYVNGEDRWWKQIIGAFWNQALSSAMVQTILTDAQRQAERGELSRALDRTALLYKYVYTFPQSLSSIDKGRALAEYAKRLMEQGRARRALILLDLAEDEYHHHESTGGLVPAEAWVQFCITRSASLRILRVPRRALAELERAESLLNGAVDGHAHLQMHNWVLANKGGVALAFGDVRLALRILDASVRLADDNRFGWSEPRLRIAQARLVEGQLAPARALLDDVEHVPERSLRQWCRVLYEKTNASYHLYQGEYEEARMAWGAAWEASRDSYLHHQCEILDQIAERPSFCPEVIKEDLDLSGNAVELGEVLRHLSQQNRRMRDYDHPLALETLVGCASSLRAR